MKGSHENLSVAETMTANGDSRYQILQNLEILTNLLYLIQAQHTEAEHVKLYATQAEIHAQAISDWFRHI